METNMKGKWLGILVVALWGASAASAAVPLPYTYSQSNAVDWTTLPGWSGNVTNSAADGSARFAAAGDTLTLALDGAPTTLAFTLRGYPNSVGVAPASFVVEESGDGNVWNSTPVADIGEDSLSVGVAAFGPYNLLDSTRYLRFTYVDQYAYDIGLNAVAVAGGPAEPRVVFVDRTEGFIVAQDAANEIITARVVNGGGYWFGSEAQGKEPWESDNGGAVLSESPYDRYFINTAATGTFFATANGRCDNSDDVVPGTIHFTVAPGYAVTLQVGDHGTATVTVYGRAATNAPRGALVSILPVPDAGYATATIQLNGETITGTTFVMPDEAAVVTVDFRKKGVGEPTLIISQYYEGSGENKWIELYNAGAEPVDLAAADYRLGVWQNAKREGWKTGAAPAVATVLTGIVEPGATYLVSHGGAQAPNYAHANVASNGMLFNGDDSVVLYTGTAYNLANVVDAFGMLGTNAINCSFVRAPGVVAGVNTDFQADDWVRFEYAAVDAAAMAVPERLGWHSTATPPVESLALLNLTTEDGALVFEIATESTNYIIYGAAELQLDAPTWAGSNINDHCRMELASNLTRITVPTTLGQRQMIWLTTPGAP